MNDSSIKEIMSLLPFLASHALKAEHYLLMCPTPCTLMYVKGWTSRTIKVAKATVMPSHILHGRSVPAECAVVEVTMITEGCEFKDLDYADKDEGIEKLVDAKEAFILWPRKDIIVKTRSSPIVSP
jgi:hypothetical protein